MPLLLLVSFAVLGLFVDPGLLWAHGRLMSTASLALSTETPAPLERRYIFRLTDSASGRPIIGAKVEVIVEGEFASGRRGQAFRATKGAEPGTYMAEVAFPATGYWLLEARVTGPVTGKVKFAESVEARSPSGDRPPASIQFRGLQFYQPLSLTLVNIGVLALHVLAGIGLLGGLFFQILLEKSFSQSAGRLKAEGSKKKLTMLIRSALVVLIATGLYNLWYNVPGRLEELALMEYGNAYLAVAIAKLLAFGLLLLTLTSSAWRGLGFVLTTVALVCGVILGHLHILIHLTS